MVMAAPNPIVDSNCSGKKTNPKKVTASVSPETVIVCPACLLI